MADSSADTDADADVHATADAELASLFDAVCRGCRPSFARLYGLTSARVFAAVLRIVPDRAEAEDVLQEVYIKAWSRCAQFDPGKGLVIFWLIGIARHGAISSLRQRNARLARPFSSLVLPASEGDTHADLACGEPGPLELVIRSRGTAAVQHCLRMLPSEHRECLVLAFYAGMTHEEIGQRVGRPLGTVKSWMRRSMGSMRAALAGHERAA